MRWITPNLEAVEEVCHEEEQFHTSQSFSHALSFTDGEWNELVHSLQLSVVFQKAFGTESVRFRKDL